MDKKDMQEMRKKFHDFDSLREELIKKKKAEDSRLRLEKALETQQ